jgi:hypothetical protein
VGQRAARAHEELEGVVEHRRVAALRVEHRSQHLAREQVAGVEGGLAPAHRAAVAAQGVDLAVVRDHAVGVRAAPRGQGVGAEPLVHQREGGDRAGVTEVAVEAREA